MWCLGRDTEPRPAYRDPAGGLASLPGAPLRHQPTPSLRFRASRVVRSLQRAPQAHLPEDNRDPGRMAQLAAPGPRLKGFLYLRNKNASGPELGGHGFLPPEVHEAAALQFLDFTSLLHCFQISAWRPPPPSSLGCPGLRARRWAAPGCSRLPSSAHCSRWAVFEDEGFTSLPALEP